MALKGDFKRISQYLWELPQSPSMLVPARIYASEKLLDKILEDRSVDQLVAGACLKGILKYALCMPDCHEGYSVPIGFVGAIDIKRGVISPAACGFDINCGMRLLKSSLTQKELLPFLDRVSLEIQKEIPSGLGKGRKEKFSLKEIDAVLEEGSKYLVQRGYGEKEDLENCESNGCLDWAKSQFVSQKAKDRSNDQVGTLGSGNHFCEIQKVEQIFDPKIASVFGLFKDQVVVMVHSGSRGLGHQVCTDYLKKIGIACPFDSKEGGEYFSAMAASANYAFANRQMMAHCIRKAWQKVFLKDKLRALYDVAHNIIKKEKHAGIEVAVHRKGATRAFPPFHPEIPEAFRETGQPVLIPGSMGTASFVLAGVDSAKESFFSTSHGAGRVMSRTQALKKLSGKAIVKDLESRGIKVQCHDLHSIAEEAPQAYKDIEEVIRVVEGAGLSKKVAKLVPLAVIKGE